MTNHVNGPITIIADTDSERLSIVKAVIGDFAETFDVSTPETRNQMYQRVITLLLAHEADINVVVSDDEALMAFVHHMANTVKGRVGQIITLGDTKKPASIQHKWTTPMRHVQFVVDETSIAINQGVEDLRRAMRQKAA